MLRPLALALGVAAAAAVAASGNDRPSLVGEAAAAPARLAPLPTAPVEDAPHAFALTRRDGTGRPVLFDPCRPVRYAVRRDGEPPDGEALVATAVAQVARATGLVLVREPDAQGPLPDKGVLGEPRVDASHPPVLLAWSSAAELADLSGSTVALGGGTVWAPPGRPGEERLVSGLVALDAPDLALLRAAPDGQERVLGVLLHELSHLVGLAHVDDPRQLLHPESSAGRLGAGDLRGLRAAGAGQCFQDWPHAPES